MEFEVELWIDEVLNLLFLPGFALCKQIKEPLSLFLGELGDRPPLFQSVVHRLPVD